MQQTYLNDDQLAERYGVSRATIWRWTSKGILPKPIKFTKSCTRWRKDQIEQRDAEIAKQSAA